MTFNCDLDLKSAKLELWVLHIISLRQTFDQRLKKIIPGVKEIEPTPNSRLKLVTFNCDLELKSTGLSYAIHVGSAHCPTQVNS